MYIMQTGFRFKTVQLFNYMVEITELIKKH